MSYPQIPDIRKLIDNYFLVSPLKKTYTLDAVRETNRAVEKLHNSLSGHEYSNNKTQLKEIEGVLERAGNTLSSVISEPRVPNYRKTIDEIEYLTQLKYEYGADKKELENILISASKKLESIWKKYIPIDKDELEKVNETLQNVEHELAELLYEIDNVRIDSTMKKEEPDDLNAIHSLRPKGPRKIWNNIDKSKYLEKLEGSLLARMAGCILGAIVEGWSIDDMESWAEEIGDNFPPTDYWSKAKNPANVRYKMSRCDAFTRSKMNGVPADDDIIYTLLGLLLLEKYGTDFKTEEVGQMWREFLYWVWKDMQWPLENLLRDIPAEKAADHNPYAQCICAGIRCDPYGYVAPGAPETAAELCYRDAIMSHRRNGLYSALFFVATISAAFTVEHPIEAVEIGLSEIPNHCNLAKAIRWVLKQENKIKNYHEARRLVDKKYNGMSHFHSINNACLTIFGLMLGGTDVTKVISNTVAMGLDNDCNAATAGSIVGTIVGKKGISSHWYKRFNNTVHSYIKNHESFVISDIVQRYLHQAEKCFKKNNL